MERALGVESKGIGSSPISQKNKSLIVVINSDDVATWLNVDELLNV